MNNELNNNSNENNVPTYNPNNIEQSPNNLVNPSMGYNNVNQNGQNINNDFNQVNNQSVNQVSRPDIDLHDPYSVGGDATTSVNLVAALEHKDAPKNLEKKEIDYKPLGAFKTLVLIVFFGGLIAFVYFLPDINSYIKKFGGSETVENKITTGKLECSLESSTANLTNNYGVIFKFTNNKLETMKYDTITRGSLAEDVKALDDLNNKCLILKENTESLNGIKVSCIYEESKFEKKQSFELSVIDVTALDAAFAEAGGNMPEFRYNDDMDEVEKNMKAAGYTCIRER